jgi:hypothetical protein
MTFGLADVANEILNGDVDSALDLIVTFADEITNDDVTQIMDAAREIDPTFSGDGADIRDALRDNTDFDII